VWRRLACILAAGQRGDADGLASAWLELERVSSEDQLLAGVYVWYMLYHHVVEIFGRRPSRDDLAEIADEVRRRYARLIRADDHLLEDTRDSVFATPGRQVTGGKLFVSGSAVLSALLDDPAAQLRAMKEPLEHWCVGKARRLRDLGIASTPVNGNAREVSALGLLAVASFACGKPTRQLLTT